MDEPIEKLPRELMHYGILRKSGRYPWGSGKDEYTRSMMFSNLVKELKDKGMPETEIAKGFGLSVADLRATTTIAKEQIVLEQTRRAVALRDKGYKPAKIAEEMGIPEPTVRLRLKNSEQKKESALRATAEVLRKNVDEHDIIDIGKGVELQLGISPERLRSAVSVLRDEGYETHRIQTRQTGSQNFTNRLVMVKPGTGKSGANQMKDRIHTMGDHSEDGGLTFFGIHPPVSISSKRLKVNFDEDGGTAADGTIYIRPGVKDLDMGKNRYAQVRIMIDGTHFIKGMAVYKDDLPDGVDIVFNTNKKREVGKLGALKEVKRNKDGSVDEANPFGSVIKRQITEIDSKTGKERAKSALNIVNEEGDWADWRKSIPSQVLAKQPHSLIKSQLKLTRDEVQSRLDEINRITNPIVRKKKLEDFAEQIDSDAVDLRAAAMPRQKTQVIIPIPNINKNEIYAPQFETGDKVVLIRFPHGGPFEIPEVTVNNNSRTAKKLLGNATDAIGIHPSVAARLSGADFDGDTVVVIPNREGKIKGSRSMGSAVKVFDDNLKNFDPKRKYGGYEVIQPAVGKKGEPGYKPEIGNFKLMTNTGKEMGMITNLITDMSIQGASPEHIVRAVRHSMVVIDAEKHKLDYKKSEEDNNIPQLKQLYQGNPDRPGKFGASTLLSRATAEQRIPERKLRPAKEGGPINPETGHLEYVPTGRTRSVYDKKTQTYLEERVPVETKVKRLALTDDAFSLVRDPHDPVERLYAEHANEMKAMANKARLQSIRIPNPPTNTKAKQIYKAEVDDLVAQLRTVQKQKPLDRKAHDLANVVVKARMQDDPTLRTDPDRKKKVERQALAGARARLQLKQPEITISDRQWDAIQAGAVSPSRLREILEHVNPKRVEELALPKPNAVMTTAVASRAKAMLDAGATTADVAASLGISASTLRAAIQRGEV